jgi:ABC-type multidrug transport system fused ATPase/permease subunit
MIPLVKILVFVFGILIVLWTVMTAVRTFVLPRGENAFISRQVFIFLRHIFLAFARRANNWRDQDRILAYYAPIVLLMLPFTYLTMLAIGFTCVHWALGAGDLFRAFVLSGSSMLTLGIASASDGIILVFVFIEAAIGLVLVSVLIAYLPTIYSAFSAREKLVSMLEVSAGTPPSSLTFLTFVHENRKDFTYLRGVWPDWEEWFTLVEESHTSLVAINFLRSQVPERNWLTAAGVILDTASLIQSTIDTPPQVEAAFCIRAGYLSLRRIASFFNIPYDEDPAPTDEISITRDEFMEVYEQLKAAGVPLKPDAEQCWRDFAGWRVNYDRPLLGLARIITAPYAPWVSDRAFPDMQRIRGL